MIIELKKQMQKLRLSGMAEVLDVRTQEAISSELSHLEFLEMLLQDELLVRQDRRIKRFTKQARFRELKTLEKFDWQFNKSINRRQMYDFATGRFVAKHENILFLGFSGVGKSHLAQAIGLSVISRGFTVTYRSAFDLAQDMGEASLTGTRKENIASFVKPDLLIIDDFGMKTLPPSAAEDILEIIMRRYEVNSTILTSNRPIKDFGIILGDNTATMAILDRFLQYAHKVEITGKSYRMQNRNVK